MKKKKKRSWVSETRAIKTHRPRNCNLVYYSIVSHVGPLLLYFILFLFASL